MIKNILNYDARRIGKTTASAFYYIGEAMQYPGKVYKTIDHHGTREANKNLLKTIASIIEKQRLSGFHFDFDKISFRYDLPFGEL